MGLTLGYDCIAENISHLPPNRQYAGYSTGTPDIQWTTAEFASHPGTLHICQDAGATDHTADYLDVEQFAATPSDAAGWYKGALDSFHNATRPGQRAPSIYVSMSNVTTLVNALNSGGVTSGPGLIVANWDLTQTQAEADVLAASGPFPIVGIQFASGQFYDVDIYATAWLNVMSANKPGLYRNLSSAGETFVEISDDRDANLRNLILRSVDNYDSADFLLLGQAKLVAGTPYYTVNP